jgi:acetoin utilization protein AcuB
MAGMNARDIMTGSVVTTSADATVGSALDTLETLDIRHLPVVNASGVLIGIVSDRDLAHARLDGTRRDAPVSGLMTETVAHVAAETPLRDIIDAMLTYKVGALPVVDGRGIPIGIVSYVDVLCAARDRL